VKRVVLVIWFEDFIPKALSYDEAKLLASARDEERVRLIKPLLGEDSTNNEEE
jgi:hypothetical protein